MQDSSERHETSIPDSAASRRHPLRADVYTKELTGIEQAVILAMLEIAGGSQELHIRIPRIAAWAKFDEKSVQRALWGDHRTHPGQPKPRGAKGQPEPECPYCKGLVQRRVLQPLSPANWKERRPACYRLNLEILDDSEAVRYYLDQYRLSFPEIKKGSVITPDPASHGRGVRRPTVAPPASHGRTDSKALDPRERGFENQPPLSLDQEGKILRDLEWAKRLARR
jgi:hypothetical protein